MIHKLMGYNYLQGIFAAPVSNRVPMRLSDVSPIHQWDHDKNHLLWDGGYKVFLISFLPLKKRKHAYVQFINTV